MEQPIKIWISKEDSDMIQEIFDKSLDPKFTILSKYQIANSDTIQIELIADSTINIWYLAKEVEMWQAHKKKIAEIIDNCKKKLDEDFLKLTN